MIARGGLLVGLGTSALRAARPPKDTFQRPLAKSLNVFIVVRKVQRADPLRASHMNYRDNETVIKTYDRHGQQRQ
jgi:hypothetical protein